MFSTTVKVLAACIFTCTQSVKVQGPDLIAMALANSLSSSASHLVQMAAMLEVETDTDEEEPAATTQAAQAAPAKKTSSPLPQ